ncbi:MAG: ISAs1 family transposase, partial [Desulfamplus sp.]|nr:ISAs1 family transposase [Desulfamplus sp.]
AAQELIMTSGFKDMIFTFDAMHCQEKTLEAVKETCNDAIIQVKKNQKQLFNYCIRTSESMEISDSYEEPVEKMRNRIESRKVEVYEDMVITDTCKWKNIKAIVKIERKREVFDTKKKQWKVTDETSYYVSSKVLSAEDFCKGIRGHWQIEKTRIIMSEMSV